MAPRVRKAAPFFRGNAVVDGKIREISLTDYQGRYLVLLFYPMDFTYVSPTEILAFSDRAKEFYHYNCAIVGLSTDSEFTHLAWMKSSRNEGGLGGVINIALLSDKSMKISRDYGVLDRDTGISHRGLYIIDSKAIIRHITMNDLEVGRSVEETLRLVRAFQFTDKYIKVCPVDWKPGDRGLRPDHQQTGRYFEGYFGITRGTSNVQIKEEQSPAKEIQLAARPILAERVGVSHSAPSNNINFSAKVVSVNRDNISELTDSILSRNKRDLSSAKVFPRQFQSKIVEESTEFVNNDSESGQYHYCESTSGQYNPENQNYLQEDNVPDYEEYKPTKRNQKERSYRLYSTTLPNNIILRDAKNNLPADIQTVSKSDTTQKYNYQHPVPEINKTDSINKNNSYRKEQLDSKAYLQDMHLKQYIYSYYNAEDNFHPNLVKVSKDNPSDQQPKYDLRSGEISKYNERIAKEQELSKARQSNQDTGESSSFTKGTRKMTNAIVAKEIQNVKEMQYHPLNSVLKIKPLQVNSSSPNIENNQGKHQGKYRGNQEDRNDEPKRQRRDYGRQQTAQEYISERRRSAARGQSDIGSQSSREEYPHRLVNRQNRNNPVSPTEGNQRHQMYSHRNPQSFSEIPTGATRTLKSSMKRPAARQDGRKLHQLKNVVPQLAADEKFSRKSSYADYVDGERRANKGRNND